VRYNRVVEERREMTTRRIYREMKDVIELYEKGLLTKEQVVKYYETLKAIRRKS
jgi:hypothetical protein